MGNFMGLTSRRFALLLFFPPIPCDNSGQTRPVTVKRLIMEGTVEERLLSVRRSLVGDHQPNCDRRSRAQHTVDGQEPKMFVERKKRQRAEDEAEDNMQRERRFTMLKELLVCPAATAAPAH